MDGGGAQQAPIIMSMVEIEQSDLVSRPCGVVMDPTGCFIKAASGPAASAPIPLMTGDSFPSSAAVSMRRVGGGLDLDSEHLVLRCCLRCHVI